MTPIWQQAQFESIFFSHPAFGTPFLTPPPVYGPSTLPQRCLWYILIHAATSATNRTIARGRPTPSPVDIFSVASESPVIALVVVARHKHRSFFAAVSKSAPHRIARYAEGCTEKRR